VTSVFGRTSAVVAASGDYTVAQVTGAAPLASPAFTGTINATAATTNVATVSLGDNSTKAASTAWVVGQGFGVGTGNVSNTGTPANGQIAQWTNATTIQGVGTTGSLGSVVLSVSPALTGNPTAPTQSLGDSSTRLATTQFVQQAGLTPIIFASAILSSLNLLALHVTPINLIPTPGAGFAIYPLFVSLEYKFNTTPYTIHGDSIKLDYGSTPTAFIQTFSETGFFDQGASQVKFFNANVANGALTAVANQPFTIYGAGGTDMTAGDGTAVVYIYYALIALQ
jgi:hypothetical protein